MKTIQYRNIFGKPVKVKGQDGGSALSLVTDMAPYVHTGGELTGAEYDLLPDKYYMLGERGSSTPQLNTIVLHFPNNNETSINQYIVRFTATADNVNIDLQDGVYLPDNTETIKQGHTYELNILYDTCLVVDITHTIQDDTLENNNS